MANRETERCFVSLLGGFRVSTGEVEVDLTHEVRRVVALLALARRPLTREEVAVRLWPDLDVERGRRRLRQQLWQLGKDGGGDLVVRAGDRLALSPGADVDLDVFTNDSRSTADLQAALADLGSDLAGGLLPRWSDPWVADARPAIEVRLREACLDVLSRAEPDSQIVELAQQASTAFPLDEAIHAAFLRLLDDIGDRNRAIRVHRQFEQRLATELNATVSGELVERQSRRMAGTASTSAPALRNEAPGDHSTVQRPERRAVLSTASEVELGFDSAVVIVGTAGLGKSVLCADLENDLAWRGWNVMVGRCDGRSGFSSSREGPLSLTMSPALQASLEAALDNDIESVAATAWARAVVDLTDRAPLALIIDDIHHADKLTADRVRELLSICDGRPVLLIGLARPHEEWGTHGRRALTALDIHTSSERIELQPLTLRAVYQLARSHDERFGIEVAERVLEATDGHQALVQQALASMTIDNAGPGLDTAALTVWDPLTESVSSLEGLPLRLLLMIALHGGVLTIAQLARARPNDDPYDVAMGVVELEKRRLVTESTGGYEAVHPRVRRAVAACVSAEDQAEAAQAILMSVGSLMDPVDEADLAALAGQAPVELAAQRAAAEQARQLDDHSSALSLFVDALATADVVGVSGDHRIELLLAIHDEASLVGDLDQCRNALRQLSEERLGPRWHEVELREGWLALKTNQAPDAFSIGSRLLNNPQVAAAPPPPDGGVARLVAQAGAMSARIEQARTLLQAALPGTTGSARAELLVALSTTARVMSVGDLGRDNLVDAVELYRASGDDLGWIDANRMLGMIEVHGGDSERGLDRLQAAAQRARRIGDQGRLWRIELSRAMANFSLLDRAGPGYNLLVATMPHIRRVGLHGALVEALNLQGVIEGLVLGRAAPALDLLHEARVIASDGGQQVNRGVVGWTIAEVLGFHGDPDSAIAMLRDALASMERAGSPQPTECVHAELAALLAEIGDGHGAALHLHQAGELVRQRSHSEHNAYILNRHGRAMTALGRLDEAVDAHRKATNQLCPGVHHRHRYLADMATACQAVGEDSLATVHLLRAYNHLKTHVEGFEPDLRDEALAVDRQLVAAVEPLVGDWTLVELPSAEAVGAGAGTVLVCWPSIDVSGPMTADERRETIEALVASAAEQGGEATKDALAIHLGVSERTIRRTLADPSSATP